MSALNKNAAFDYEALPADIATEARAAADRIRDLDGKIGAAIIEIGESLITMKERLGHGNFKPWLLAEFGWSISMAKRFMNVARRLGDRKSSALTNLARTTLYLLAAPSTPEPIVQQTIERVEHGDKVTTAALQQEVDRSRGKVVALPTSPARSERRTGHDPKTLSARIAAADEAHRLATRAGISDPKPVTTAAVDAVDDAIAEGNSAPGLVVIDAIRTAMTIADKNVATINLADTDEGIAADLVRQIGFNRAYAIGRALLTGTQAAGVA